MSSTSIERRVLKFARDCPCERCRRVRERVFAGTAQERLLEGMGANLEEDRRARWSDLEILWLSRFVLRGAHTLFLDLVTHVKRFAAVCPCSRCTGWRSRLLVAAEDRRVPELFQETVLRRIWGSER